MITAATNKDGDGILAITSNAGVFTSEEVDCVGELWSDYIYRGAEASGYYFLVYRVDDHVEGFACYGPRALTEGTYDLYWIATDPACRRRGIGQALLRQVENEIHALGGRLCVVETSGIEKYASTRKFYLAEGYQLEATIHDFYKPGDDLVVFTKHL